MVPNQKFIAQTSVTYYHLWHINVNVDIIDCRMTSYVASQFYIHSLLRINTEVPYKYSKEILCVSILFLGYPILKLRV